MSERAAEIIVEGRYFCEGPRWQDGRFWFSDFFAREVCSVGLDGDVVVEAAFDGRPSGLGWLPDGSLLVVSMLDRKVMRRQPDGSFVEHADLSALATFHANDMLVDDAGTAYVGNFGFDIDATMAELGVEGMLSALMSDPAPYLATLAAVTPDGTVSAAAEQMLFPNGMVLTDDGRTLVVAQTLGMELTAFDRAADGTLSNRRVWAPLGEAMIAPDGIAIDADGGIWVANAMAPSAHRVVEGGAVTDVVTTSQLAFACQIGGPEGRPPPVSTAPWAADATPAEPRGGRPGPPGPFPYPPPPTPADTRGLLQA